MARMNQKSKRVAPYYTHEQINTQADFIDRAEPIVWIKNRLDRFFLEVQRSGRITLDQDGELRVHYASSNGNTYGSIGRYLIEKKRNRKGRQVYAVHPDMASISSNRNDEVRRHNESFVFFKQSKADLSGAWG